MSTIIKRVENNLPSPYRSQTFTQEDAGESDILDIKTSLGRPAKNCTIEVDSTGDGMSVRFNVQRTAYPRIPRREGLMYVDHLPYLTSGEDYVDESSDPVIISAGNINYLETGPAISDIQIVTASGHWSVWVS